MQFRLSSRITRHPICRVLGLAVALGAIACDAGAAEGTVAVAANFTSTAQKLADTFERRSGHKLVIATGSTGQLYAQIRQGAPFDALLAADQLRPARLFAEKQAAAKPFTYATGQLALWSPDPGRISSDGAAFLASDKVGRIALANPKLAPYGLAARESLEAMGLWDGYRDRIVMGQNIAQAFQITASGGVSAGFVALSQLQDAPAGLKGSHWVVPAELHTPIRQDAVLLLRGKGNPAAKAFLAFLTEAEACTAIRAAGYAPAESCP
ncbi:molybdate ABC transporter substrate-binding protein [Nisaea sediminum]|uniref:molybdate ABC transporter substrate-binding protein n=1 Tax=Nisaea sediminum TaxID=2775867 RepID=UPI001868BDEC|nr:molybdate ABC transporter substrate-binding protein [Nisaea sediminum]